jgi:DNA-binding transcriptional ArsR family regulator
LKNAARVFRALADPTRRQILQELKDGELTAGAIVGRFPISGPSISRHLAILRAADLVRERRDGNRIFYRLDSDQLAAQVSDFLSQVCPTQFAYRRDRRSRGAS